MLICAHTTVELAKSHEPTNLGEYAEEATIIMDEPVKPANHFIEANTQEVTLNHLKNDCITPVFSKDNELTINHAQFVETIQDAVQSFFSGEKVEQATIRASHIIKGRIPEAIHKPANQLLESDKTIYYERMMFCFEIPTIYEDIAFSSRKDICAKSNTANFHDDNFTICRL